MDLNRRWRSVDRLEQRHRAETGIIVAGKFVRYRYNLSLRWQAVRVLVDGTYRGAVFQTARWAIWIDVAPGRHTIDLVADSAQPFYSESFEASEGDALVLRFRVPRWTLVRKPSAPAVIGVADLRGGVKPPTPPDKE
jgi:hypothetical protein